MGGVAFSPMKDWTVEAIAAAGWPAGGIRDKFGRLCVAYVAIKSNLELAADTHTKLIQISAKLVKDIRRSFGQLHTKLIWLGRLR